MPVFHSAAESVLRRAGFVRAQDAVSGKRMARGTEGDGSSGYLQLAATASSTGEGPLRGHRRCPPWLLGPRRCYPDAGEVMWWGTVQVSRVPPTAPGRTVKVPPCQAARRRRSVSPPRRGGQADAVIEDACGDRVCGHRDVDPGRLRVSVPGHIGQRLTHHGEEVGNRVARQAPPRAGQGGSRREPERTGDRPDQPLGRPGVARTGPVAAAVGPSGAADVFPREVAEVAVDAHRRAARLPVGSRLAVKTAKCVPMALCCGEEPEQEPETDCRPAGTDVLRTGWGLRRLVTTAEAVVSPLPASLRMPAALVAARALARRFAMGLRPTLAPTLRQQELAGYGGAEQRPSSGPLAELRPDIPTIQRLSTLLINPKL